MIVGRLRIVFKRKMDMRMLGLQTGTLVHRIFTGLEIIIINVTGLEIIRIIIHR